MNTLCRMCADARRIAVRLCGALSMLANRPKSTRSVTQINVETYKSVVQLSGFVDSTASMNKAVAIAR